MLVSTSSLFIFLTLHTYFLIFYLILMLCLYVKYTFIFRMFLYSFSPLVFCRLYIGLPVLLILLSSSFLISFCHFILVLTLFLFFISSASYGLQVLISLAENLLLTLFCERSHVTDYLILCIYNSSYEFSSYGFYKLVTW